MSPYQEFIYYTRYSRWLWDEGRRENWPETVARYADYITEKTGTPEVRDRIYNGVHDMRVMPSMRALMTAGPALDVSNVAGFNCSYLVIDNLRAFDELLYILMNGTGVGFSVERRYVNQLPTVPSIFFKGLEPIVVEDSKIGWAEAIKQLIHDGFNGTIRDLDTHKVRLAGEPLKTFGGRASGPEPLVEVAEFIVKKLKAAAGRQLTSLECHDICCKIAACVVVGGVRRSALISLSDLDDEHMRGAKSGEWWIENDQRALANNSAVYEGDIDRLRFDPEWQALVASGSGERGIFNRTAARQQAAKSGRDPLIAYGTNPCGEILLRPNQFCNLTEVIARAEDTEEDFYDKVELSTIMGTFQSSLTDFGYLRSIWKENSEEERLLGVSITGIYDAPALHDAELLIALKEYSHEVNRTWAARIGINPSASVTCVKPSGTVSQLTNTANGVHPRYARYYIRRVRNDSKDPVSQFLIEAGFKAEVDFYNPSALVFAFPMKAPDVAVLREEINPIQHLETWLLFKNAWSDHNPSVTINVKPDEWDQVGDWVFDNFDNVCGLSFLPYSAEDSTYVQLPYEEIDEETYNRMVAEQPKNIYWPDLYYYEKNGESITAGRELACVGGACEL